MPQMNTSASVTINPNYIYTGMFSIPHIEFRSQYPRMLRNNIDKKEFDEILRTIEIFVNAEKTCKTMHFALNDIEKKGIPNSSKSPGTMVDDEKMPIRHNNLQRSKKGHTLVSIGFLERTLGAERERYLVSTERLLRKATAIPEVSITLRMDGRRNRQQGFCFGK